MPESALVYAQLPVWESAGKAKLRCGILGSRPPGGWRQQGRDRLGWGQFLFQSRVLTQGHPTASAAGQPLLNPTKDHFLLPKSMQGIQREDDLGSSLAWHPIPKPCRQPREAGAEQAVPCLGPGAGLSPWESDCQEQQADRGSEQHSTGGPGQPPP